MSTPIRTQTAFEDGDGGTSGVAGDLGTTARTDGTNRTFTEDILKTVVKEVYASGGNPKVLMVNPAHKQLVSAFTGIAAQRFMAKVIFHVEMVDEVIIPNDSVITRW